MQERRQDTYPLLRQFREFYVELTRLRRMAEETVSGGFTPALAQPRFAQVLADSAPVNSDDATTSTALIPSTPVALAEDDNEDLTQRIWTQVADFLDQKIFEARSAASALSRDLLEELVYVMAAFADETFVCLVKWPGSVYWRDHLMELRLFRSQISGQLLFRRIDDLLSRQSYADEELCAVYLMVLSLGFRGRYLRQPAAMNGFRDKLYERLLMLNPEMRRETPRLFPEAYRHTVSEGAPTRLPEPRTWWLVVAAIVGLWFVLSTIGWFILTRETRSTLAGTEQALDRIIARQPVANQSVRWNAVPFAATTDAFRLDLTSQLPLEKANPGQPDTAAPLLLAVTGPAGASPGPASDVQTWLSRAVIAFPTNTDSVPPKNRTVASVSLVKSPPRGVTVGTTTLAFFIRLGVSSEDLALHPQLILPTADAPHGVDVSEMVLYLPNGSQAGAQ
ncbi:MAG TPA: DotU family type IV/VI secretion system protein, partial [Edaphobacter sp.]|nr:DotU family type IV/VI secretion system protein [Edaphobacter sp.]